MIRRFGHRSQFPVCFQLVKDARDFHGVLDALVEHKLEAWRITGLDAPIDLVLQKSSRVLQTS